MAGRSSGDLGGGEAEHLGQLDPGGDDGPAQAPMTLFKWDARVMACISLAVSVTGTEPPEGWRIQILQSPPWVSRT